MKHYYHDVPSQRVSCVAVVFLSLAVFAMFDGVIALSKYACATTAVQTEEKHAKTPLPYLSEGSPVDWWFVFKFNAATFPGCDDGKPKGCPFGGTIQDYGDKYSQQFIYASNKEPSLQKGTGCLGATLTDPVGSTFNQVYRRSFYYVLWNDQFYDDPKIQGCSKSCNSPWGHSKGMLAWNDDGEGFVMQVSTPSWPASGNKSFPRESDGNTLGCISDNDVKVSQHFFALRLTNSDLINVLKALENSSVATDPYNVQIVKNGGPLYIQKLVKKLGKKSRSTTHIEAMLSTGVKLISKPSELHVPAWQLVSAELDGVPLRTATWWATPKIYSTTSSTAIKCWHDDLGTPGPVKIATSGIWDDVKLSLKGGPQLDSNHAKFGVSLDANQPYVIFGDLNQQGALSGNCASSQNGRGGIFFILNNKPLFDAVTKFMSGNTAPEKASVTKSIH